MSKPSEGPSSYPIVLIGTALNSAGGLIAPFLALYLVGTRGESLRFLGLAAGLLGGGSVLAGLLGGRLSDRIGRRNTLTAALLLSALNVLLLGMARSKATIAAMCFSQGVFGSMHQPAANAVIADEIAEHKRANAYRTLYWVTNVGFAIAAILAGYFASRSFKLLFAIDAATSVMYAAVGWLGIRKRRSDRVPPHILPGRHAVHPFRNPAFIGLFALTLLLRLVFLQALSTLPVDMMSHGISFKQYGLLAALNGVLVVLLQPLWAALVPEPKPARALATSTLLMGLGFGLNGVSSSVLGYAFAVAVWTIGEIAGAGVAPAVVASLAPPEERGSYLGAFQVASATSTCLAPSVGTFIMASYGARVLWATCCVVGLVLCVSHLVFTSRISRSAVC